MTQICFLSRFIHLSRTQTPVTQENNHQVDTHIHDGLQEFTSTFQLLAELEIPLYSQCCFLPEERLQRRRSQRRFDYLMGKIRRCGAAGPCRCIDVQKKETEAQGAWKRGKNNCDDFVVN